MKLIHDRKNKTKHLIFEQWKSKSDRFDIEEEISFYKSWELEVLSDYKQNYQDQVSFLEYLRSMLVKYKSESEQLEINHLSMNFIGIIIAIAILILQTVISPLGNETVTFGVIILFVFLLAIAGVFIYIIKDHRVTKSLQSRVIFYLESMIREEERKTIN